MSWLKGKKTNIVAALGKLSAVIVIAQMVMAGDFNGAIMAGMALFGFGGMSTMRAGVQKAEDASLLAAESYANKMFHEVIDESDL